MSTTRVNRAGAFFVASAQMECVFWPDQKSPDENITSINAHLSIYLWRAFETSWNQILERRRQG